MSNNEIKINEIFQNKIIFQLENEEILNWLELINLGSYKEIFKSNKINGNDLYYMTNDDIKSELKINNIHERYLLIKEINKLKCFKIRFVLNFNEEKVYLNLDFESNITLEKIFPLICNVLHIPKVFKFFIILF